jgi:hypothetical protein
MDIAARIIAQNRYTLLRPPDDFLAAAAALVSRVRDDGHPGVLAYQFFCDGPHGAANVIYANAAGWIGHHDLILSWPAFADLRRAARLEHVTLLGPVTQGMRDWLTGHGLTVPVTEITTFAAGFDRRKDQHG